LFDGAVCASGPPKMSPTESNREEPDIVTPKKGRPLNLALIERQRRFRASCREGKPARKRPHLRLDGGHYSDVAAFVTYHMVGDTKVIAPRDIDGSNCQTTIL
jgi:hypothetical protein